MPTPDPRGPSPDNSDAGGETLVSRVLDESVAMAEHALNSGKEVEPEIMGILADCLRNAGDPSKIDVTALTRAHNALASLIQPSVPRTVLLLKAEKGRRWARLLGPIPLIRVLLLVGLAALASFIVYGGSELLKTAVWQKDFFDRTPEERLMTAMLLLSAATIGASFANLVKAYQHVVDGTYDPTYDMTYGIRLVMGLLAGYMLAEIVPLGKDATFGKPLLAILGGFSAGAVERILNRLMETVETLVRGNASAIVAAREAEIKAQTTRKAAQKDADLAAQIVALREGLKTDGDVAAMTARIDALLKKVIADVRTPDG